MYNDEEAIMKKVVKDRAVVVEIVKKPWGNCRVGMKLPLCSAEAKKLIAEGRAIEVK